MYLFNRVATANPDRFGEAIEWAVKIAKRVETITGTPIRVYSSLFGDPMNTISWGTTYASLADMETLRDKLLADSGYQTEITRAAGLFVGAPNDLLLRIVSSTFDTQPKRYYQSLTMAAAPGKLTESVMFTVKLQAHITKASGLQALAGTAPYGAFGTAALIVGADSMAELDHYNTVRNSDAAMPALLAEAATLFAPESGVNRLVERIA